MDAVVAGWNAGWARFRAGDFSQALGGTATGAFGARDWCAPEARAGRYALYRAMLGGEQYSDDGLGAGHKADLGLYAHTRPVYSVAGRLVEFHVAHLMGGPLDPAAGDGHDVPSCLPIEGVTVADRKAIAQVWKDSRWAVNKAVWTRTGVALGDAPLRVTWDAEGKWVALAPVDPAWIYSAERDYTGDLTSYRIVYPRPDPKAPTQLTDYTETAEIDPRTGIVTWRTYIGNPPQLHGWDGNPSEYDKPLGFIPLWIAQHIDLGRGWGRSELEAGRPKMTEADDLASLTTDNVRKTVNAQWFIPNRNPPATNADGTPLQAAAGSTSANRTAAQEQEDRQDQRFIYLGQGNTSMPAPAVCPLPIEAVNARERQILDSLEDDYPELRFERLRLGGTVSGEALRVARQPAAGRIMERRPAYDEALIRGIKGCLALGGLLGFPAYRGYGPDDYWGGKLANLSIGPRPVFGVDEVDRLAEITARFAAVKAGADAGVPLEIAMRDAGFSPKDIADAKAEKEANARLFAGQLSTLNAQGEGNPNANDPNTQGL